MGKLSDIIKGRFADNDEIKYNVKVVQPPVDDAPVEKLAYDRKWLDRVAIHQGFVPSDDGSKVNGILGALNRRNGQCPCGGSGIQYKCPCDIMRNNNICKCGLFKTLPDRDIKSKPSSATIKVINKE